MLTNANINVQAGVRRGVRASGSYQEGTGKSGSYSIFFLCVCEPFRFHPRARFSLLLVYVFTERIFKANMSLKSVIYTEKV